MTGPHVLVVGTGSAGRRHARNLAALGARISGFDPRADRLELAAREVPLVSRHTVFDTALDAAAYDGMVVASPPVFHVEQASRALDRGVPVLLEKPVSPGLAEAERLEALAARRGVAVLLGYTWRWWPPIVALRHRLDAGEIGELRHARFVMSAHLSDWHPGEPLDEFFMSRAALGGGALLDESHWLDLLVWMLGMPERLSARIDRLSALDIDSDDNVDMILELPGGLRVTLHLDLFGRPHEKSIQLVGEGGTLRWSEQPNEIALWQAVSPGWQTTAFDCERHAMFMALAREFLAVMAGAPVATCDLADGVRVLRIVEAARTSSASGCAVTLPCSVRNAPC